MTFIQSTISFGGYTFPAGFALESYEQDAVIDEYKIPYLDGTSAPAGTRNSKIIKVLGTIGGFGAVDSNGDYITSMDNAENELQLMQAACASGYQQFIGGYTPARYIYAQMSKFMATPREGGGRMCIDVEISFLAQDPRWLSTAVTTTSFGSGATHSVTNAGTSISYPKATFTGVFVNPYLQVTPAGGSGYIKDLCTITMGSGDVLVIDCDPRNRANAVLLNGVPRLDLLGTSGITNTVGDSAFFPYLKPGSNSVVIGASSGSGAASLASQDAWL